MTFAAVILAGGASRRMGSPKALLTIEGETFLDRLTGVFEPLCDQVIVVLGHHADTIRSGVRRSAAFVVNPDPERGQLSSLQTGLREVRDVDGIFFTPVDFPAFRAETLAEIRALAGPDPVVPQYNGRHGHPVLIPRALVPEFLALSPDDTARVVMHRHAAHTRYLEVDDPGILVDVDDPEAYRAITQASL